MVEYVGPKDAVNVALEGALKLKEISYIHVEGYPAAGMKQGITAPCGGDATWIAPAAWPKA